MQNMHHDESEGSDSFSLTPLAIAQGATTAGTIRYFFGLGSSTSDKIGAILCYKHQDIDGSPDSLGVYLLPDPYSTDECLNNIVARWQGTDDIKAVAAWDGHAQDLTNVLQLMSDSYLPYVATGHSIMIAQAQHMPESISPRAYIYGTGSVARKLMRVVCVTKNSLCVSRYRIDADNSKGPFFWGAPTLTFTISEDARHDNYPDLSGIAKHWKTTPVVIPAYIPLGQDHAVAAMARGIHKQAYTWLNQLSDMLGTMMEDGLLRKPPHKAFDEHND